MEKYPLLKDMKVLAIAKLTEFLRWDDEMDCFEPIQFLDQSQTESLSVPNS